MNEEIQAKVLEEIGNVAEMGKQGIMKAVEVLQEQCPLLVEELLRWEFTVNLILFLIAVLAWASILLYVKKLFKWDDFETPIPCLLVGVNIAIPFLWANLTWLKIWIAPRIFLLEYVSDLIK